MSYTCKKDFKNEVNNKYENYLNNRDSNIENNSKNVSDNNFNNNNFNNNNFNNNNNNNNNNNKSNESYNKEEFIDEIMKIHNDIYFNPYKILEIDKDYNPKTLKDQYKIMAMKYHPDKGGDADVFKEITQSYIYLLKKYKENLPDKQIYELKNDFEDFTKTQSNNTNILMQDSNFNLNQFNNIFNDNFTKTTKGYGDFLKNGTVDSPIENDSYIFSDTFNVNVFNKIFNTKTKKQKKDTIIVYKEPATVFQSNNGYSELDEDDELDDYTSGFTFNSKIQYTDCKKAYTNPEDLSNIDVSSFNSIDDLEKHRSNISYEMAGDDLDKYNNYLEALRLQDLQKQKKIEKKDIGILKKYRQFNNIMIDK
jgi:hypothetical protein